jgi:hypothetical protein
MEKDINETKYRRAQEQVIELKKFYNKAFRGILAIVIAAGVNYYINEWTYPWFLWVVFGVGLGISLRAIRLFAADFFLGKNWEEQKVKELMNKDSF